MIKRKVNIKWMDYSRGNPARYEESFIYKYLIDRYVIEFTDKPDYLICSLTNHEDLDYDCVKIIHTIENVIPDFSRYDYVIGFDYLTLGDRYLRMPLFATYEAYGRLKDRLSNLPSDEELLGRKFCSFVVSNRGADPLRDKFFHELSKYKRVDSAGRHLNNVGAPCKDKLAFCSDYKFNIAIENSVSPGYTTEKIMEPLAVNSVPIYYGDPLVNNDFTPECMVRISGPDDIERAIEEVIALDKDDVLYLKKVKSECLVKPWDWYKKQAERFLDNVFGQDLRNAKRTADFGHQMHIRRNLKQMYFVEDILRRFVWPPVLLVKRLLGKAY